MRLFIIVCLLLASFPSHAQTAEAPTSHGCEEANKLISDFVTEEIEKEWNKHVARLAALAKDIKAAKLKLQQLKVEISLTKYGEASQKVPPYPFPSNKCEDVSSLEDTSRCVWYFKNPSSTHICEDWWINESGLWHQELGIKCRKLATWTLDRKVQGGAVYRLFDQNPE